MRLFFSFIVPVFNRPEEIRELLDSFAEMQTNGIDYEILIVEDGSTLTSKNEVKTREAELPLRYFFKENSGPGDSRNFGMEQANGNYFIILDSDLILPPEYLKNARDFLKKNYVDCFGGADAADHNFTPVQKAINFVMTSFLTTGGIRGKEKALKKFEPRSFNMGLSKEVFEATGGFGKIHPGEDPDLSIRIEQKGFKTAFAPGAYVYHKRRIDWRKFHQQVHKFGLVRPILTKWHPKTFSLVFWLPSLFVLGVFLALVLAVFQVYFLLGLYILYFLLIFVSSAVSNKSLKIGALSLRATFIQFFGYGLGYLKSTYYINICRKNPRKIFPGLFFE